MRLLLSVFVLAFAFNASATAQCMRAKFDTVVQGAQREAGTHSHRVQARQTVELDGTPCYSRDVPGLWCRITRATSQRYNWRPFTQPRAVRRSLGGTEYLEPCNTGSTSSRPDWDCMVTTGRVERYTYSNPPTPVHIDLKTDRLMWVDLKRFHFGSYRLIYLGNLRKGVSIDPRRLFFIHHNASFADEIDSECIKKGVSAY